MSHDSYTEDLSRFGFREIKMLRDILEAWVKDGLPRDFNADKVRPAMNANSGYVFLVNEDYQTAMMNGDKLEPFYNTPYNGYEGFFDDLLPLFREMHPDDQEYMRSVAEAIGREDSLPEDE